MRLCLFATGNDHECLSTAVCEMGLSDVELTAITTLEKEVCFQV